MSKANGLELDTVPETLVDLNELEVRLISQRLMFMSIRELQKGMKGPAVNVPARLEHVQTMLPRIPADAQMVTVNLKRKLGYKSAYMTDCIAPDRVKMGLEQLCKDNPLYADVIVNDHWVSDWQQHDPEVFDAVFENTSADKSGQDGVFSQQDSTQRSAVQFQDKPSDMPNATHGHIQTGHVQHVENRAETDHVISQQDVRLGSGIHGEEESRHGTSKPNELNQACSNSQTTTPSDTSEAEDRAMIEEYDRTCRLRGLPYNSCLQNEGAEDIRRMYNIAPGEGQKPIPLLTDGNMEELSHPDKFPLGRGGFNNPMCTRATKLSLKQYICARLLDADGRFARDVNYIFAQQYAAEHKQLLESVSVALRQTKEGTHLRHDMRAGQLCNPEQLAQMFQRDDAYRYLKSIRGSPPYWQTMFYDCLAMIRSLGIATFFFTLSAAVLRWPEVIQAIAAQYGVQYTLDEIPELAWTTRSKWLRSNPVTAARMFQHRVETLMTKFLQHHSAPIGVIQDYLIRVEFQARGSPHVHTIIWIKDAPKLGVSRDEEVIKFIDKYISCELPANDDNLRTLVESLQTHVCNPQCMRSGHCRYRFPRAPSAQTIITHEPTENVEKELEFAQTVLRKAQDTLAKMDISTHTSVDELLHKASVTIDDYTKALSISRTGSAVILQRKPREVRVNNYNPAVLTAWEANMDIQYVVNAYACVMYVASYVMKAEKGMSELLKRTACEIDCENVRSQLRKVGSVFLTNRELSAQEAVYRSLQMPLRKFSKAVVFINTDERSQRVKLLKPKAQLELLDEDDENVFCNNIIDRYIKRPDSVADVCLADFAAVYRYRSDDPGTKGDNTPRPNNNNDELPETHTNDDEKLPRLLNLPDGLGKMTKRRTRCVVRWHNFQENKEPDKFYRSQLMLFLSWRDEDNMKGEFSSYKERYEKQQEEIQQARNRHVYLTEDLQETFQQLQQEGPPEAAWDVLAPGTCESRGKCINRRDYERTSNGWGWPWGKCRANSIW